VLLDEDRSVACLHEQTQVNCGPRYWLRDFSETDPARQNCLVTPPPEPPPEAPAKGEAAESQLKVFDPPGHPRMAGLALCKSVCAAAIAKHRHQWHVRHGRAAQSRSRSRTSRQPPAASGAPALAAPPADSKPPPDPNACKGKTVYIQIFGPELRDRVRLLREPWRDLGASIPPVEDVLDTARRRGRNAPQAPSQPTVIFHDRGSEDCAYQLPPPDSPSPWTVRSLSPQLSGTPGTIEVWIPPLSAAPAGHTANAPAAPTVQPGFLLSGGQHAERSAALRRALPRRSRRLRERARTESAPQADGLRGGGHFHGGGHPEPARLGRLVVRNEGRALRPAVPQAAVEALVWPPTRVLASASYVIPVLFAALSTLLLRVPFSLAFWQGAAMVCGGAI
jgi:hypothetical protein